MLFLIILKVDDMLLFLIMAILTSMTRIHVYNYVAKIKRGSIAKDESI